MSLDLGNSAAQVGLVITLLLSLICPGCGEGDVITGPYAQAGPLEVAVTINSSGDVVLSGAYSQKIVGIHGLGSVGWLVGFEKTLYKARKDTHSLFILWEDESGEIWRKQYDMGEKFEVRFTREQWVRKIKRDDRGNIIVFVEPLRSPPTYDDLRDDIQELVKRWDELHHRADRYWETDRLNTVLRSHALQEQLETVDFLRSNNCYWTIRELTAPTITRFEAVDSETLVVEVYKNWDMDLYCSGAKEKDDDGPFTMRYEIEKIDNQWYITYKQVV